MHTLRRRNDVLTTSATKWGVQKSFVFVGRLAEQKWHLVYFNIIIYLGSITCDICVCLLYLYFSQLSTVLCIKREKSRFCDLHYCIPHILVFFSWYTTCDICVCSCVMRSCCSPTILAIPSRFVIIDFIFCSMSFNVRLNLRSLF